MHTCARARKRNQQDDLLANVRNSCASAAKGGGEKNPNGGSHDAGAGGRKQNPQHDFLANARSSCASAAEGGGEKKFQTEVVKMLVLVAVLN